MKWFPRMAVALWVCALLGGCSASPERQRQDAEAERDTVYSGPGSFVRVRHYTDTATGCEYLLTIYSGYSAQSTPRMGTKCSPAPAPAAPTY